MKLFYCISFIYFLFFSQNAISAKNFDYNKWLKNEKFSINLIDEIEHILSTKNLSKLNNIENINEIQSQIISYLNILTEYQYEYIKLRSSCSYNINEINFNYFEEIEQCIKKKNLKLLKKYFIADFKFETDDKLLIDNAETFKNKFINLHTHEVKKENYDIIMENYYTNIQNINYNKFENQFNLLINFILKKYN